LIITQIANQRQKYEWNQWHVWKEKSATAAAAAAAAIVAAAVELGATEDGLKADGFHVYACRV